MKIFLLICNFLFFFKECNHARMNETRDRLRKKLSQLVNARKNMKPNNEVEKPSTSASMPSSSKQQQQPPPQQQPISLKSAAKAATAAAMSQNAQTDDDSLECLNTLCKRISHLHTSKTGTTKKQNVSSSANSANVTAANVGANRKKSPAADNDNNGKNGNESAFLGKIVVGGENGLDVVSEIYEFLDNYSKDQTKVKKWIKETLSYIEGSDNAGKKQQPQTTNPKKAAKKLKQKQRKEEEKRIDELQVLRAQFSDIYFKEFSEKQELKSFKSSKKKDKKRIAELETNIKKLQRAKSKVETEILELIATVKQTNSEFKFSYLPTKEQQQEKMKELLKKDTNNAAEASISSTARVPVVEATAFQNVSAANNFQFAGLPTAAAAGSYALPPPYAAAAAGHYPYHLDFQANQVGPAYGMIRPPLPNPMCYAPPQHQQLSPDVVAAMAANAAACNANTDPSKRIVTIRRVNLPNVPEPQVTVTARGSSPDKDKLLYTFVNGQLVPQSGITAPLPQKQMQMQAKPNPLPRKTGTTSVNSAVDIPPPPPLSKSQLKKERRRQAKAAAQRAEEEAALAAQAKLMDEIAKAAASQKKKTKPEPAPEPTKSSKKSKKNKKTQFQVESSTSSSSVSTTASAENVKQSKAAVTKSIATKQKQHSNSSSTTATPASSQINTRDNSVASQKTLTTAKSNSSKESNKNKAAQKKKKINAEASTTAITLPSIPPIVEKIIIKNPPKEKKIKKTKLVDNGQFDNNPFKSLHMQDSDYDSSATSSDEDSDSIEQEITNNCTAATIATTASESGKQSNRKNNAKKSETCAAPKSKQSQSITAEKASTNSRPQQLSRQNSESKIASNSKMDNKNAKQQQTRCSVNPSQQQQNASRKNKNNLQSAAAANSQHTRNSAPTAGLTQGKNNITETSHAYESRQHNSNKSQRDARNSNRQNIGTAEPNKNEYLNDNKNQNKRIAKQNQRNNKKFNKKPPYEDCSAGIPQHMDYFNPADVAPQIQAQHEQHAANLAQQMQGLRISNPNAAAYHHHHQQQAAVIQQNYNATYANYPHLAGNVSIMDQLNRGVQVENLSLPPGITLTKVDPAKSELLRQKSESIKRLSHPLTTAQPTQSFHHHAAVGSGAATIIAPPVNAPLAAGYYAATPYAGVVGASGDGSNIIMVEPNANHNKSKPKMSVAEAAANASEISGKTSKNKKRRNKSKPLSTSTSARSTPPNTFNKNEAQSAAGSNSRMITLRNPMFHGVPPGVGVQPAPTAAVLPGKCNICFIRYMQIN